MPFYDLGTLGDANDERLCFFDTAVRGIGNKDYCFAMGLPVKDFYPSDAKIFLKKEYPGMKLASFIGNSCLMLVVSRELRETIEKHCPDVPIEYLPFTLIDHRRRVHSTDYCLVNPLGTLDCADKRASDLMYTSSGKVSIVKKLVLDPKKVKGAPQLFRADLRPGIYIVGPELAQEISSRKFTNVLLTELEMSGS